MIAEPPTGILVHPHGYTQRVMGQGSILLALGGAVRKQGDVGRYRSGGELARLDGRRTLLPGQKLNDSGAVVLPAGAADLVEFRVQQLLQPLPAGANARVMKLDFELLESGQVRPHS